MYFTPIRFGILSRTNQIVTCIYGSFLAELSSGPKGRRAEPHNYRARIEIEKTMRLSFMVIVASGMARGRVGLAMTTTLPKMAAILQKKLGLGILGV